jgi:hypothetical protein
MFKLFIFLVALSIGTVSSCSENSDSLPGEGITDSNGDRNYLPLDFFAQCSDERCDFSMYEGERIEHGIATWHKNDTGIEMVGDKVMIAVEDGFAGHEDVSVKCYQITMLGGWDDDVIMSVDVKFWELDPAKVTITDEDLYYAELDESMVVSHENKIHQEIKQRDWELFTMEVKSPAVRGLLRFDILKEGAGQSVLYFAKIEGEHVCSGDELEFDY